MGFFNFVQIQHEFVAPKLSRYNSTLCRYMCMSLSLCVCVWLCLSICITQAFVKTSSAAPSSWLYLCLALNRIFGLKVHSLYATAAADAAASAAATATDVAAAGPMQTAFK